MNDPAPSPAQHLSIAHRLEAVLVACALRVLRLLPPIRASNLGGFIARTIGPRLPVSKVADRNLRLAMPELDAEARKRVVRDVWDNLGRTACEFPHLAELTETTGSGPGWVVKGAEHLIALARSGGPVIFVSGHIGNWEVLPRAVAAYGLPFASFYRAAANPRVDAMIGAMRANTLHAEVPNFAKGARGARDALRYISRGGHLGILADQKMNDGIEVRFFGLPAMTASAAATFALRYNCPIVTGHVRRVAPARFEVIVDSPFRPVDTGNRQADIATTTQVLNDRMEATIRQKPGSWLWLHRRWPKRLSRSSFSR
ncbi:lysophospholipid acyltransferase family protein [Brytella acorum]|uniref:Lauroyl acyltransferase n=1 Tax=Brytella acorum TaxID=2959299 RepID=A0AA35UR94_9PROT|nr:lauroyl acyltransferase [Brytella acorum]MDF3624174.1 lauroyl acyltransferase [Brytella acorum]CAI9120680.1 lauroyl acyltransferase [Brytella acorum]